MEPGVVVVLERQGLPELEIEERRRQKDGGDETDGEPQSAQDCHSCYCGADQHKKKEVFEQSALDFSDTGMMRRDAFGGGFLPGTPDALPASIQEVIHPGFFPEERERHERIASRGAADGAGLGEDGLFRITHDDHEDLFHGSAPPSGETLAKTRAEGCWSLAFFR